MAQIPPVNHNHGMHLAGAHVAHPPRGGGAHKWQIIVACVGFLNGMQLHFVPGKY